MLFQKSTIGFQFNQFVGTQLSRVYTFICLCVYKVLNQNYETSRFLLIFESYRNRNRNRSLQK